MATAALRNAGSWILVGLLGRGIGQSRTPGMQESEARAQGLKMAYTLFDFTEREWNNEELSKFVDAAETVGFVGLNVTYPFKQAIIELLDDMSVEAERVGAVNTIRFENGKRIGHNTDVTGFARSMQDNLPGIAGGKVLQIGCGGGGSATSFALLGDLGIEQLYLHDRDAARASQLAGQLNAAFGEGRAVVVESIEETAPRVDGLLNASPMGMDKYPGTPIDPDLIEARHWVAEIVYFPLETEFLRVARGKGCRTVDGSGMAIGQAADAFRVFTGREADRARMKDTFFNLAADD